MLEWGSRTISPSAGAGRSSSSRTGCTARRVARPPAAGGFVVDPADEVVGDGEGAGQGPRVAEPLGGAKGLEPLTPCLQSDGKALAQCC